MMALPAIHSSGGNLFTRLAAGTRYRLHDIARGQRHRGDGGARRDQPDVIKLTPAIRPQVAAPGQPSMILSGT